MSELIIKIGPLFWVLSVLAVYGLAVVAERILYFHRIQINTGDCLRGISRLVKAGTRSFFCTGPFRAGAPGTAHGCGGFRSDGGVPD